MESPSWRCTRSAAGGGARLANLSTRAFVGTGTNILIPGITISAGSGTRRLLLRAVGPTLAGFGVTGTLGDPKLELYAGATKVTENDNWEAPAATGALDAAALAAVFAGAGAFPLAPRSRDAALVAQLGEGSYTLQVSGVGNTSGVTLVEIYDLTPANQASAGTVYVARLRPEPSATGSAASGLGTILINADGTATVNVTFSNLSSGQTSAHLRVGATGDFVLNLPRGQVSNATWNFSPVGTYTTADLIKALNTGTLTVGLDSTRFPSGELRGTFVPTLGSQSFVPPAAPPAVPASLLAAPSATEAARFLMQATFGPTTADITALRQAGIPAWIEAQMALPMTSLLALMRADNAEFPTPRPPNPAQAYFFNTPTSLNATWWKLSVTSPDQLRHRVAFALSELFVVSTDVGSRYLNHAQYYDLLARHAFGSFRQLLEEVTLSPVMGEYLTYIRTVPANPSRNTSPDENYAREVQQLFTVGLVQLQPDGTLRLDAAGQPIATYDQRMISETAKVFTGWGYGNANGNFLQGFTADPEQSLPDTHSVMVPMVAYENFHDRSEKRVLSLEQVAPGQARPTIIPAGQTAAQDLRQMLDTLVAHPNTGPFVCRQLIQRLVTSNPSPGYVYRVARAFADDGTGTRGNLGAVVRALLTDYEARSPSAAENIGYGKVKEPIIRVTAFLRALKARAPNGRFLDGYWGSPTSYGPDRSFLAYLRGSMGQEFLYSPTVFNFFTPDYILPGPTAAAGLVVPEMQITDSFYSVTNASWYERFLFRPSPVRPTDPTPSPYVVFDLAEFLPQARTPSALVDQLNLLFCANAMSAEAKTIIVNAVQSLATGTGDDERVRTAVYLTAISAQSAVQR